MTRSNVKIVNPDDNDNVTSVQHDMKQKILCTQICYRITDLMKFFADFILTYILLGLLNCLKQYTSLSFTTLIKEPFDTLVTLLW